MFNRTQFTAERTSMQTILLIVLFVLASTANAQWTRIQLGGSDFNPGTYVYVDDQTIYVGSMGMIFRSIDGGTTFVKTNNGITDGLSSCTGMVKIGDRLYASFGGNGSRGVYYSVDQGASWVADSAGWTGVAGVPVLPFARRLHQWNDKYLFAILETNFTMFKRPEDQAWKVFPVPSDYRTPADMFFDGDTVFVCQTSTTVPMTAYTTDLGETWNYRQGTGKSPLANIWMNRTGGELYASNADFAMWGKEWLLRSTNNGMSWDTVLPRNTTSVKNVYADGDIVLVSFGGSFNAADSVNKIMLSIDRGNTWTDISANYRSVVAFGFHSVASLALYGNTVFAGIDLSTGVITRTIDIKPTSVTYDTEAEQGITVFPNPAHDRVHVVGSPSDAAYHIIDLHGQRVAEGSMPDNIIDMSAMRPGLYTLVIQAATSTQYRRIVRL
ncbi:MAG: T9SS type A sorting domain-containing protein [Candidatus Kapabacteria bacterium]|nr:T9SS type A sorting domain-containing protein [Candidatus Kapabacteria bacterium]